MPPHGAAARCRHLFHGIAWVQAAMTFVQAVTYPISVIAARVIVANAAAPASGADLCTAAVAPEDSVCVC